MRYGSMKTAASAAAGVALVVVLAGCANQASLSGSGGGSTGGPNITSSASSSQMSMSDAGMSADLVDATGATLGTVDVAEVDGAVQLTVTADGMPPGFHALHVHTVGLCEPDSADPADPTVIGDFLSAGGHLGGDMTNHGDHMGDLPSLFVESDGTGLLEVQTDAFTLDELMDTDGSAVMVHAGADDFANIPERYAPGGPDAETLKTGDSGGRIACAVLQ